VPIESNQTLGVEKGGEVGGKRPRGFVTHLQGKKKVEEAHFVPRGKPGNVPFGFMRGELEVKVPQCETLVVNLPGKRQREQPVSATVPFEQNLHDPFRERQRTKGRCVRPVMGIRKDATKKKGTGLAGGGQVNSDALRSYLGGNDRVLWRPSTK